MLQRLNWKWMILKLPLKLLQKEQNQHTLQHVPVAQPVQQIVAAPAPVATNAPASPAAPAEEDNSKYIVIKSPMIGTLYRKPAPDKATFLLKLVANIGKGDVCIVEAMKLFNEIEAGNFW